jgi:hypothetical protein
MSVDRRSQEHRNLCIRQFRSLFVRSLSCLGPRCDDIKVWRRSHHAGGWTKASRSGRKEREFVLQAFEASDGFHLPLDLLIEGAPEARHLGKEDK